MKYLLLFATLPLFGAVDGLVINGTTGKPQGNATVTIYKFGEAGMESMETVKSDPDGKFKLNYSVAPGGPHLIQAAFEGVTYNKMLNPGAATTGVEVEVFSAIPRPGEAKVSQHMLLFEPVDGKLMVSENIVYQNPGKTTFNDPAGSVRFYLPAETGGKVKVMCAAPNGMPIEKTATAANPEGVYSVDFPIKPGETRIQLSYELPLGEPALFAGRLLHKEGTTRLVTPKGVSLSGDGITELGREPQTQAAIYNVAVPEFKVTIEGTGSLRAAAAEEEGPGIQEIQPRIYDRLTLVLGLSAATLLTGLALVYRNSPQSQETAVHGKAKRTA